LELNHQFMSTLVPAGGIRNIQTNAAAVTDADFYFHSGLKKQWQGDWQGALADYDQVIRLKPEFADAFDGRAAARIAMGDADGALADENRAIELNPKLAWAYNSRGFMNYNRHEFAQAAADFRKFCELNSKSQDDPRFRIWLIQARGGDPALANSELQTYLDGIRGQRSKEWQLNVGLFLTGQMSETGLFQAADAAADPKQINLHHCDAWFYAGSKQLIQGNKILAAEYFQKCLLLAAKDLQAFRGAASEMKFLQAANTADH
jgi:lipoprotein NlpI